MLFRRRRGSCPLLCALCLARILNWFFGVSRRTELYRLRLERAVRHYPIGAADFFIYDYILNRRRLVSLCQGGPVRDLEGSRLLFPDDGEGFRARINGGNFAAVWNCALFF